MHKSQRGQKIITDHGPWGLFFLLAYIGAAVYFIKLSAGFWGVLLALLKAAIWPAFVIYHVLQLLNV